MRAFLSRVFVVPVLLERVPTFKPLEVTRTIEPLSVEELYAGYPIAIDSNKNAKAVTHVALFSYEDAGAIKTIRCTDGTLEGEDPAGISAMVKVNGLTKAQWQAAKWTAHQQ